MSALQIAAALRIAAALQIPPPHAHSIYPEGVVTTLDPQDMPYLRKALEAPASSLLTPAAGLAPEYETVELLSAQVRH